ncbi:MAG: dihydroneopterin aldolase [Betaproteobacteria bacterium]|nr:dihydroneopterin aldolase [Betaproteobacteria bacterium]
MPDNHHRILSIQGLRFHANLGILDHELKAPQEIQVDADLNVKTPMLQADQDTIIHVLDYRLVRNLIIQTCTDRHVNLLESLTGKLCQTLLSLPNVVGTRARITKLHIFHDCEVSIQQQVGDW